MSDNLLIVDGDNGAHRLYHAVRDRPPAEAFGFWLGRLLKRFKPTHAVVVFDPLESKSQPWRCEIRPSYKANKPERPASLVEMLRAAREECRSAQIAVAEDDGLEADDLIGAYVASARAQGWRSTIVSGDKDLTQLVCDAAPAVRMVDDVRGLTWTELDVRVRLGVVPELVPDLLALVGDKSDGFPGVPGIGPKIAVGLLERYGSLEGVLGNKNLISSDRVMKLLREHEASARACYKLACLRTDRPLPAPLHSTFLR